MFNFGQTIPTKTVEEVKKSMDEDGTFSLLDVRTPGEYSAAKINGSINIPLDEINEKIESVILNKNKSVYVYCLSGSRSSIAVSIMIKLGYKNVFNVKSGLLAWRAKNYPLEN